MTIYQKLQDARVELAAMPLKKSGKNTYAGYTYFELGDFLPHAQKIFAGKGLCGIVSYTNDEATLQVVDSESGESITIHSPMRGAALKGCHDIQNLGAVETYQRRYLWVTAMELVENDILDGSKPLEEKKGTEKAVAEKTEEVGEKFLKAVRDAYEVAYKTDDGFAAKFEALLAKHGVADVKGLTTREKQLSFWEDLKAMGGK